MANLGEQAANAPPQPADVVTLKQIISTDTAGNGFLYANAPGDSNYRMHVDHNGSITWSSGSAAGDVALSRLGIGILGTAQTFQASALRISGNMIQGASYLKFQSDVSNDQIIFAQSTGEIMRINASGQLVLGPSNVLGFSAAGGTGVVDTDLYRMAAGVLGTSNDFQITSGNIRGVDGRLFAYFNGAAGSDYWNLYGTTGLFVHQSGGSGAYAPVGASAFNVTSDEKLKDAITSLDGADALDNVIALRGVSHDWVKDAGMGDRRDFGFIAQEVQDILPELVTVMHGGEDDPNDETLGIDYCRIIPIHNEAITELARRLDALEAS